jgi:hypothetical protein
MLFMGRLHLPGLAGARPGGKPIVVTASWGARMLQALEISFALWGMILRLALSAAQCIAPRTEQVQPTEQQYWSRRCFLLHRTPASSPLNLRKYFGEREIVTRARFRSRVVKPMTIHRLFKDTAFGPDDIERLVAAYEQTLRALRLKDRNDPITQLVAEKIIEIGRTGIEDPAEISKLAFKQLGPP